MPEVSGSFTSSPPEPPPKMSWTLEVFNFLVIGMLSTFATKAFFEEDWIIFSIDIVLISINIYFRRLSWISHKKMNKVYAAVKEAYDISCIPIFRHDEETDTAFITVVGPSAKLISELRSIRKEFDHLLKKAK